MAGNERFCSGQSKHSVVRPEDLADLAQGQHPFATILGCSDSRVSPEWIFDAGLGELFVVRVAGNVLSAEVAGSIQYAGSHLQTPLFVVLGHEGCGAVQAALAARNEHAPQLSRIQVLVNDLMPALDNVDASLSPQEQLAAAVESNVRWTIQQITDTPEAQARLAAGRVKLIGAVYEIATGRIRLLT